MVVTLEWVRDNYDTITKDRYIDKEEAIESVKDFFNGKITKEQTDAVQDAFNNHTLLPAYTAPVPVPICRPGSKRCRDGNTIEQCRADGSGWDVVQTCGAGFECKDGTCVSVSPAPPPNMETRTVSLTEGSHTIQVSLTGYDTLNATTNVSSTGVTCVSVIGGACGGSSLPRVSTSGWTVTTYLKSGAVTTNRCTWIATKDTSKVAFISEMVLAYNNLANIGFTPSASEIGQAVLMYAKLGTPASLWGC